MCSRQFLSLKNLQKYAGVSRSVLNSWIEAGMPIYRLGPRCIRVNLMEFHNWAKQFRVGTDKSTSLDEFWNQAVKEVQNGIPE